MVMPNSRLNRGTDRSRDDYDPHIGRHVLQVGFVLALAALSAIWITTAYLSQ